VPSPDPRRNLRYRWGHPLRQRHSQSPAQVGKPRCSQVTWPIGTENSSVKPPALFSDAHTETTLYRQLSTAATVTQLGGPQLHAIAARTRTIVRAATTAHTPAAQRAVRQALHRQVARANAAAAENTVDRQPDHVQHRPE
jgi:hypothetical protein